MGRRSLLPCEGEKERGKRRGEKGRGEEAEVPRLMTKTISVVRGERVRNQSGERERLSLLSLLFSTFFYTLFYFLHKKSFLVILIS